MVILFKDSLLKQISEENSDSVQECSIQVVKQLKQNGRSLQAAAAAYQVCTYLINKYIYIESAASN